MGQTEYIIKLLEWADEQEHDFSKKFFMEDCDMEKSKKELAWDVSLSSPNLILSNKIDDKTKKSLYRITLDGRRLLLENYRLKIMQRASNNAKVAAIISAVISSLIASVAIATYILKSFGVW